jgi:hypothetical protein
MIGKEYAYSRGIQLARMESSDHKTEIGHQMREMHCEKQDEYVTKFLIYWPDGNIGAHGGSLLPYRL